MTTPGVPNHFQISNIVPAAWKRCASAGQPWGLEHHQDVQGSGCRRALWRQPVVHKLSTLEDCGRNYCPKSTGTVMAFNMQQGFWSVNSCGFEHFNTVMKMLDSQRVRSLSGGGGEAIYAIYCMLAIGHPWPSSKKPLSQEIFQVFLSAPPRSLDVPVSRIQSQCTNYWCVHRITLAYSCCDRCMMMYDKCMYKYTIYTCMISDMYTMIWRISYAPFTVTKL